MRVRIATVCQAKSLCRSTEGNRNFILGVLDKLYEQAPDIVCLPEAFTAKGVPARTVADVAEPIPGPTTEALADLARKHRSHIICPIYTERHGTFRNSAVLIGRDGTIEGIYDKAHPSTSSWDYTVFEGGIAPGDGSGVFDLDFGRVALRICMDVNFPEDWQELEEQGTRIAFWPSAFDGGMLPQAYALLHHCYVVSAVRTGRARVINPCGRTVAETAPGESYAIAQFNPDYIVARQEFNRSIPQAILAKYGREVRVDVYPEDSLFLVEPVGDGLTTEQLQGEFGFESAVQFVARHREAYRQIRQGLPATPQSARHGDRPCD